MLSYVAIGTSAALLSPPLITAVAKLISALRTAPEDPSLSDTMEDVEVMIHVCNGMTRSLRKDREEVAVAKEMLDNAVQVLDTLYDKYTLAKDAHNQSSFRFLRSFDEDKWVVLINRHYLICEKRMNLLLKIR